MAIKSRLEYLLRTELHEEENEERRMRKWRLLYHCILYLARLLSTVYSIRPTVESEWRTFCKFLERSCEGLRFERLMRRRRFGFHYFI